MASRKIAYGTSTAFANIGSIASLASSSSLTAGYELNPVDNTTNLYLDYTVEGKIRVGTTPTINTEVRIYVIASFDGATWPDVFDGTPSVETIASAGVRDGYAKKAISLNVDVTTTGQDYPFSIGSIAELFGGVCPAKWTLFITHNTVAALDATGANHAASYRGAYETVA